MKYLGSWGQWAKDLAGFILLISLEKLLQVFQVVCRS